MKKKDIALNLFFAIVNGLWITGVASPIQLANAKNTPRLTANEILLSQSEEKYGIQVLNNTDRKLTVYFTSERGNPPIKNSSMDLDRQYTTHQAVYIANGDIVGEAKYLEILDHSNGCHFARRLDPSGVKGYRRISIENYANGACQIGIQYMLPRNDAPPLSRNLQNNVIPLELIASKTVIASGNQVERQITIRNSTDKKLINSVGNKIIEILPGEEYKTIVLTQPNAKWDIRTWFGYQVNVAKANQYTLLDFYIDSNQKVEWQFMNPR